MNIRDQAMLVRLSIHRWSGKKSDDRARDAALKVYDIERNDDEYVKKLLPKTALSEIQSAVSAIRKIHEQMTLPWDSKGVRILPSKMYFQYAQALSPKRAAFDDAADALAKNYPAYIAKAQQTSKALFDMRDYPSVSELRAAFSTDIAFLPFPDVEDWRVDIGVEELERVKSEAQNIIHSNVQQTTKNLWSRLSSCLQRVATTCADPDARIYETMMGDLYDLVQLLPALNLTEDKELEHLRQRAESELCVFSTDRLKVNPEARRAAGETARALCQEIR